MYIYTRPTDIWFLSLVQWRRCQFIDNANVQRGIRYVIQNCIIVAETNITLSRFWWNNPKIFGQIVSNNYNEPQPDTAKLYTVECRYNVVKYDLIWNAIL